MQQGIQSLHAAVELFVQNKYDLDMFDKVYEWAINHKTVRILSARGGEDFNEAVLEAKKMAMKYKLPWAEFKEPDINDMTTAFGFVVTPEMVFEVETTQEANALPGGLSADIQLPEGHELAQFLSYFSSAR